MESITVGIDLAKQVFPAGMMNGRGRVMQRCELKRGKVAGTAGCKARQSLWNERCLCKPRKHPPGSGLPQGPGIECLLRHAEVFTIPS